MNTKQQIIILIGIILTLLLMNNVLGWKLCSDLDDEDKYCCKYPSVPECEGHNGDDCWCSCGNYECETGEHCCWNGCLPTSEECPPETPPCTKETCNSLHYECGEWDDNCGGDLDCGDCSADKGCRDASYIEDFLGKCGWLNGHTCSADKDCAEDNCIGGLFKPGTYNITWGPGEPESKVCCGQDNLLSADMKCKNINNTKAKWTGSSLNDIWAVTTNNGWYDCDNANANCDNICEIRIPSGEATAFGEYNATPGINMCCGDDPGEHRKNGTQSLLAGGAARCCNSANDCVDANGNCVPGGTIIGNKVCAKCGWTSNFNWDGTAGGCCPNADQCLVDESGNSSYNDKPDEWYKGNTPVCIKQGQYLLDHLCGADGQWFSRTSRVAGAMISNQLNDYIIACDNYTNNLNYYGYNLNEWMNQYHFLWETGNCTPFSCFNNFCVARDKEGEIKAVGGSVNPDKGNGKAYEKVYLVLNVTGAHCSDDTDRNEFVSCGKGLVFNPMLNAFVYTKREGGFFQTIINFFSNLVSKIVNPIKRLFSGYQAANPSDPIGYLYNYKSPNLDVLYVADVDSRYVIGMMDRFNRTDRMLINYSGVTEGDLCLMIENTEWNGKINCTKTSTGYSLFGKSRIGSANILRDAWVELTYKLRFN